MKKILQCVLILMLASTSVASYSQGKTSIDPSITATKNASTDTRLSQKITYSSGYKRLHVVTEELSQISGVAIGCGNNKKDWRVRDIPLVVCVKDMPLGKLLRAIADATHTWFASEQIGKGKAKSYRIYRRYQEEQKIDNFFKSRHDARLEGIKWQWNALATYAKSPEITDWPDWMMKTRTSNLRLTSKLIASLGSDAMDKMLEGETFRFKGSDPAYRDIIEQLYQNVRAIQPGRLPTPTSEQLDMTTLKIKLRDIGDDGNTGLDTNLGPLMVDETSWSSSGVDMEANLLDGKLPGLPPYPKQITYPDPKDDMANSAMVLLGGLRRYAGDETWNHPKLKAKIDVEKPEGAQKATFANLISAVAKASGLNIVTEDFTSHQPLEQIQGFEYQQFDRLFGKQTNVASVLTNIKPYQHFLSTDYTWFYDEKDDLMVGWADDGNILRWRDQHRNLIAADYLDDLKRKLDGPGVELDDIVPLMTLPEDMIQQWIRNSKDLSIIGVYAGLPAWVFYASLSNNDKAKAKTDAGLPLSTFDPVWIAGFFLPDKLQTQLSTDEPSPPVVPQEWAYSRAKAEKQKHDFVQRAIYDPQIVSTMVMRVIKSPATTRWMPHGGMRSFSPKLKLSKYELVIIYKMDGREHKYNAYGPPMAFPTYSTDREAEVIKASQ